VKKQKKKKKWCAAYRGWAKKDWGGGAGKRGGRWSEISRKGGGGKRTIFGEKRGHLTGQRERDSNKEKKKGFLL